MSNRQDIMARLVEFLESDLEALRSPIDESLSLREGLGLDSVDLVGIIMRIEGHYRIRLSHLELEKVVQIKDLLDLIESKLLSSAQNDSTLPNAA